MSIVIRTPGEGDFFPWLGLYESYAAGRSVEVNDMTALTVWSWISDAANPENALVAVDDGGSLVGLVHFQAQQRPLDADRVVLVDDLHVAEGADAKDVARQLLDGVSRMASDLRATSIRWISAGDDASQGLYDGAGSKTDRVVYEAPVRVPVTS